MRRFTRIHKFKDLVSSAEQPSFQREGVDNDSLGLSEFSGDSPGSDSRHMHRQLGRFAMPDQSEILQIFESDASIQGDSPVSRSFKDKSCFRLFPGQGNVLTSRPYT